MGRWLTVLALLLSTPALAAPDKTPRTAIISAFAPEWLTLRKSVASPHEQVIGGTRFVSGTIAGRPVLLFLSGMSMVNAAMTTQSALDHFTVSRIVFSGIAGGVDPALDVGDVVVPGRWSQYLESTFARDDGKGGYALPGGFHYSSPDVANYGMIFPRAVQVSRDADAEPERKLWFDADPALLDIARKSVTGVKLGQCVEALCLKAPPRVVVGGNGVSGPVFMDNAAFRDYAYRSFHAQVLDMETAAVAQVAYANRVPFIAFRSLSDLAGGDPGTNQAKIFFRLASENSAAVVATFIAALPSAASAPARRPVSAGRARR